MSKTMSLQVAKWGNSLAMRIPSEMVRRLGLRDGDSAQLTVDGALTIRPAGWSRRAFAAELDTARAALPVGASVIEDLRQSARY
jgi:antitoxin MazE